MPPSPSTGNEFSESTVNIQFFLFITLAMIIGLSVAILLLPTWLPNMATSLAGDSPKVYWYLSRATAFVGPLLLWARRSPEEVLEDLFFRPSPGAPAAFA